MLIVKAYISSVTGRKSYTAHNSKNNNCTTILLFVIGEIVVLGSISRSNNNCTISTSISSRIDYITNKAQYE